MQPANRWAWCLVPFVLWLGSALLRAQLTLSDTEFDTESAQGLLKSDPGLLYYLTERVVDSGGAAPADWRADPRIEHPDLVDIPAVFTVGQEFLVARAYGLFGGDMPLHVFCVWSMAFLAAAAVFGIHGAGCELTGSRAWGALAGLLYVLSPANYRTVGFVLIREDLSLPLYALHLWALSRALSGALVPADPPRAPAGQPAADPSPRVLSAVLAVLTLWGALSTWHGMGFVVALEAAALLALFVLRGVNPLGRGAGRLALPALVLLCALVPALRPKLAQGPLWLLLAAAPWLSGYLGPRLLSGLTARLAVSGLFLAGCAGLTRLLGPTSADLSHVTALLAAKIRHLGRFPADPASLPFDVRLLWQGPFATATLGSLWESLLLLLLLAPLAWLWTLRGAGRTRTSPETPPSAAARDRALEGLALLSAAAVLASWLVARVVVLPGLLLPLLVVAAGRRLPARGGGPRALLVVLVLQGLLFARWAGNLELGWYRPSLRQKEIAAMVEALPGLVPEGEAVAADFMNSTAILAHAGRPIVLQPKWERASSRARVERFWSAFYGGSPGELHALLTGDLDCRYLLVDRFTLWILRASRNVAGLPPGLRAPLPGTAAEALLDPERETPGYELIWRSPQTFLQSNGRASDFFRLYRLDD